LTEVDRKVENGGRVEVNEGGWLLKLVGIWLQGWLLGGDTLTRVHLGHVFRVRPSGVDGGLDEGIVDRFLWLLSGSIMSFRIVKWVDHRIFLIFWKGVELPRLVEVGRRTVLIAYSPGVGILLVLVIGVELVGVGKTRLLESGGGVSGEVLY
jgi:hypothetical protein